jgi:uncharacterized membrane protein
MSDAEIPRNTVYFRPSRLLAVPTSRILALTDGIYAVIATLLVLNLKLPSHLKSGTLGASLLADWPQYVALFVGFVFVFGAWVNSHRLGRLLKHIDHYGLLLWAIELVPVILIPFAVESLGGSFGNPSDLRAAVLFLLSIVWLTTLLYTLEQQYFFKRGLIRPEFVPFMPSNISGNYVGMAQTSVIIALTIPWPWVGFAGLLIEFALSLSPLRYDIRLGVRGEPDPPTALS